MWIFTALASQGLFFSFMLWRTEQAPGAGAQAAIAFVQ